VAYYQCLHFQNLSQLLLWRCRISAFYGARPTFGIFLVHSLYALNIYKFNPQVPMSGNFGMCPWSAFDSTCPCCDFKALPLAFSFFLPPNLLRNPAPSHLVTGRWRPNYSEWYSDLLDLNLVLARKAWSTLR